VTCINRPGGLGIKLEGLDILNVVCRGDEAPFAQLQREIWVNSLLGERDMFGAQRRSSHDEDVSYNGRRQQDEG
jgi:hypothetical protein